MKKARARPMAELGPRWRAAASSTKSSITERPKTCALKPYPDEAAAGEGALGRWARREESMPSKDCLRKSVSFYK